MDLCYLGEDYTKQAFVLADRHIEVHAAYGFHHRVRYTAPVKVPRQPSTCSAVICLQTRTPKCGRAMAYNHETCDLYVVGSW